TRTAAAAPVPAEPTAPDAPETAVPEEPDAPAAPQPAEMADAEAVCARRIVLSTIDARLIELDAETGLPCPSFGENGTIDLKVGVYSQTSAPTVVNGMIIIGVWVADTVMVGDPSGVVRAFSAETGELVWA